MNAPRSGCPINLTLEALGDRWSLIVIRDLMFGNRRHFRELPTRSEERIASNIAEIPKLPGELRVHFTLNVVVAIPSVFFVTASAKSGVSTGRGR